MGNEIALATNWESLKEQAGILVKSGFLPVSINTPEKAIAVMLTCKELGIGAMEGFRSINVIQGKPTISPQLMLALANRTGQLEDIEIDSTNEFCRVTVTRKGRKPHSEKFGISEATDLQLIGRDNYKKQPATMFKWRALAAVLRVTFPDVMLGFYTPEEMGAEVRITDSEEMEITSTPDEGVNLGVRVPKNYWDLKETDPAAAQALLGEDCYPKKVSDPDFKKAGWYIFSKSGKKADEFVQGLRNQAVIESQVPPEPLKTAPESFVSVEEQTEILRMAKEKGMTQGALKSLLKDEFNVPGWSKVTKSQYPQVIEALIRVEVGA